MPLYVPGETVPPMYPPRKAVLYVVDEATGKTYPIKVTLADNTAMIPVSVEKDDVLAEKLRGFELLPNGARLLAYYGIGVPDRSGLNGLNGPRDAFELSNGNWLITDMLNHRVIEVNPYTKQIVWQYGTTGVAGSGANQLNSPYSAVRMPNGDTLIADEGNYRIIEVTPDKQIVWTLTGADLGVAYIYPSSVQFTEENTILFGNEAGYPHVFEVAYPSKAKILDLTFSGQTYAHKIQSSEVRDTTDFYHYRHILVVDFSTGYFYNFNPDGTQVFSTYRYSRGNLECVDMWADRQVLLTDSDIGAVVAYVKSETLEYQFGVLFGNKASSITRGLSIVKDVGYCHRTPDGNLLVSDYGADMVYKVAPRLDKLVPFTPLRLWINESVTDTTNGSTTPGFLTAYADKKTFYIISDQSGTLYIQAYNEVAGAYADIDSTPVSANTLTPYSTTYGARLMCLRFVPSASATVSAWAVLE
jgi:hypothetical protein